MIVRAARPSDAAAIAAVHVASWRGAYRGLLPQNILDDLSVERRAAGWERILSEGDPPRATSMLAEDDDGAAGFVNWCPSRDPEADRLSVGELTSIYVLPERFGHGIGRALMRAALDGLTEAGYRETTLWVLAGNARAIRFYTAAGWRADGTTKDDELRGAPVTEIRYAHTLGR